MIVENPRNRVDDDGIIGQCDRHKDELAHEMCECEEEVTRDEATEENA